MSENARAYGAALFEHGPIDDARAAKELGLSMTDVARAADELVEGIGACVRIAAREAAVNIVLVRLSVWLRICVTGVLVGAMGCGRDRGPVNWIDSRSAVVHCTSSGRDRMPPVLLDLPIPSPPTGLYARSLDPMALNDLGFQRDTVACAMLLAPSSEEIGRIGDSVAELKLVHREVGHDCGKGDRAAALAKSRTGWACGRFWVFVASVRRNRIAIQSLERNGLKQSRDRWCTQSPRRCRRLFIGGSWGRPTAPDGLRTMPRTCWAGTMAAQRSMCVIKPFRTVTILNSCGGSSIWKGSRPSSVKTGARLCWSFGRSAISWSSTTLLIPNWRVGTES